jgi:hypothetical protein
MAQDMAHFHNILLRCLNALYLQAPYLKTDTDKQDFITLTNHFLTFLHHHHEAEENDIFPEFTKAFPAIDMSANVDEHRAFDASYHALLSWASTTTPTTYSPSEAQTLLHALGTDLAPHLRNEITTLLALRGYDSATLLRIWSAAGQKARKQADTRVALPMLAGNMDVTFEGGAVSELVLPWMAGLVVDWVLGWRFKGAWRLLPCDAYGRPRKLAFGPEE